MHIKNILKKRLCFLVMNCADSSMIELGYKNVLSGFFFLEKAIKCMIKYGYDYTAILWM